MLNDTTPPFRELLLNRLPPPDDRDYVRVVMRLKQREALAVVESAIKIDGLDFGVKAVEDTEELSEDAFVYSDRYDTLRGYKEYGEESGESVND